MPGAMEDLRSKSSVTERMGDRDSGLVFSSPDASARGLSWQDKDKQKTLRVGPHSHFTDDFLRKSSMPQAREEQEKDPSLTFRARKKGCLVAMEDLRSKSSMPQAQSQTQTQVQAQAQDKTRTTAVSSFRSTII